jgi:hypothetical protein
MAVTELAKRVTKLESVHDTNTTIFTDSFKMLEIQLHTVHEVISMLHHDGAGLVEDKEGRVDFNYYLQCYMKKLTEAEEKKDAPPPPPVLASPDDDSPRIFGG